MPVEISGIVHAWQTTEETVARFAAQRGFHGQLFSSILSLAMLNKRSHLTMSLSTYRFFKFDSTAICHFIHQPDMFSLNVMTRACYLIKRPET